MSGFIGGDDAPAEADMYRCVHCGLCISACPTYGELSLEAESPRGRIALMKAVNEGRLTINPRVVSHWDMCLQCRACEAVCPSGVPYGRIMANTRAQVAARTRAGQACEWVSRLFLRGAAAAPGTVALGRAAGAGLPEERVANVGAGERHSRLIPGGLKGLEAQLPEFNGPFFDADGRRYTADSERRMTVGLLSGCVMPLMQGDTMRAAVRVLTRNGCDVVVPDGQGCCGALNVHAGDLEYAREMARRNIDVFLDAGVDAIVTASAGCGSAMKEYDDLLKDDPRYAGPARRLAQR